MKKILTMIPITVLIILLSNSEICSANTLNEMRNNPNYVNLFVCKISDDAYRVMSDYQPSLSSHIEILSGLQIAKYFTNGNYFGNLDVYYSSIDPLANPDYDMTGWSTSTPIGNFTTIICIKGSAIDRSDTENKYFPSLQDYEDFLNPPSDPTWYQEMWDALGEALGDPNFWFGEWFIDIIDNVFGNDDEGGGPSQHSITSHFQIADPTLTPAPTPIPFTTVVIPKTDPVSGDTYYETNYYYNNPSGTPIIQPYPPTNSPSTNSPSSGSDYIPIGGDPYSIPVVSWLTSATIGDTEYDGIDSVGSGLNSIDEVGSEYTNGMGAIQDATGTLPTSWLLLIGIAAAIPLIAGIISRFLS